VVYAVKFEMLAAGSWVMLLVRTAMGHELGSENSIFCSVSIFMAMIWLLDRPLFNELRMARQPPDSGPETLGLDALKMTKAMPSALQQLSWSVRMDSVAVVYKEVKRLVALS
jgi:hypothetical protein